MESRSTVRLRIGHGHRVVQSENAARIIPSNLCLQIHVNPCSMIAQATTRLESVEKDGADALYLHNVINLGEGRV